MEKCGKGKSEERARNFVEREGGIAEGCRMDEEQIANFVAAYLKKKGFKETEQAFQEELRQNKTNSSSSSSSIDLDFAKHLLSFSEYFLYPFNSYPFLLSLHFSYSCVTRTFESVEPFVSYFYMLKN